MNFKKMNTANGSDYYPQVNDVKMVRVTATFPVFRGADTLGVISGLQDILPYPEDEWNMNFIQVEEAEISLQDLNKWAEENNGFDYTIENDNGDINTVQTVIDNTEWAKNEAVEAVKTEMKNRRK